MAKTSRDHITAVIKAGVSALPYLGSPLASLIDDYIPIHTEQSVEKTITLLNEQLRRLEERIDLENINKDEFAELFKSTYLIIVRTHQEEKIKAAVALLANMLLKQDDKDKLPYTQLDHFCRSVEALSIGAIQVLGHSFEICTNNAQGIILGRTFNHNFHQLRIRMPDMETSLIFGCVAELNALNLVHLPGAPTIRTEDYSNYNIELTSLGISFILYLIRWPDSPSEFSPTS